MRGGALNLTFVNDLLARLCNRESALAAWAGDEAPAIEQLLNELDCADHLGQVEELPYIRLLPASAKRIGVHGADDAGVLLAPELTKTREPRDAESAVIFAVAVGPEEFNPEGAAWPRAFAMSRITQ